MFQTVIVDDDPFSQEMMKDLLKKNFHNYSNSQICKTVNEAVDMLSVQQPDLIFLDMELPDGKGFDVLNRLPHINFEVIVTTMHDEYMLGAIRHSALDYLMKPVNKSELKAALEKFERKIAELKKDNRQTAPQRLSKLALPTQDGMVFLNIHDIIRLESEGAYTKFITIQGDRYLTSKSIGNYEDQLSGHSFFRVHHGHLINLNHIRKYVRGDGGYVMMSDNSSVDVSRRKKDDFMKAIGL